MSNISKMVGWCSCKARGNFPVCQVILVLCTLAQWTGVYVSFFLSLPKAKYRKAATVFIVFFNVNKSPTREWPANDPVAVEGAFTAEVIVYRLNYKSCSITDSNTEWTLDRPSRGRSV